MTDVAADTSARRGPPGAGPLIGSEKIRGIFWQALLLAVVVGVGWYLFRNTQANLARSNIQVGFDFLWREAGFEIAEAPIAYDATRTYGRAFLVGVLNTLYVSLLGIVLATILGTLIGVARLSSNWLVAKLASAYVEVMRNVPLLLQLFAWYVFLTELLPPVRQAINLGDVVFLSQRGLSYAWPVAHPAYTYAGIGFVAGVVAFLAYRAHARRRQNRTGVQPPLLLPALGFMIGIPLVAWLVGGAPTELDVPRLSGFGMRGGRTISPEFTALLIGLSTYTAAFIAEVVRGGILAVDRGQTEASMALGLSPGKTLRLVTLPQALRVIVPPMTSQYLNLTKNSSLAVAIGYPELVSVANTSMNQTGQAIEAIAILMAVYLAISLTIAVVMNIYNSRVRLVER
jgi:general L-amino acid transport system permease protein